MSKEGTTQLGPRTFNDELIDEYRANQGRVSGRFEGEPLVLVHHVGRRTGTTRVTPLVCLPDEDKATVYVFASKAGGPRNPDWYHNLVAAGRARIESGADTHDVTVRELRGEERDRIYAEQVRRRPRFGEYAAKAAAFRSIPVLALTRA